MNESLNRARLNAAPKQAIFSYRGVVVFKARVQDHDITFFRMNGNLFTNRFTRKRKEIGDIIDGLARQTIDTELGNDGLTHIAIGYTPH